MTDPDRAMDALFAGLKARQQPPDAAQHRAYEAARAAFLEEQDRHGSRLRNLRALAAVLTVTVLAAVLVLRQPESFSLDVVDAARLEMNGAVLQPGERIAITAGDTMAAAVPARLVLGQSTDLRLAGHTALRWVSESSFELTRGRVFVDTGDHDNMTVITARGAVRDIGTRFLVALDDDQLEVAVRAGKTIIDSDLGSYQAGADGLQGDVVTLTADRVISRAEPVNAPRWDWIHSVPRGYEETAVAVVLEQIARDLGVQLEYADPGVKAWVMNLRLHGDQVSNMSPLEALEVVASTSDLLVHTGNGQSLTIALP
ncbi:MAG: FecR family protein [Pseudomonadales bacterium]|nr:FecR domain-containing protein [Pseudomonadales bacterium]